MEPLERKPSMLKRLSKSFSKKAKTDPVASSDAAEVVAPPPPPKTEEAVVDQAIEKAAILVQAHARGLSARNLALPVKQAASDKASQKADPTQAFAKAVSNLPLLLLVALLAYVAYNFHAKP